MMSNGPYTPPTHFAIENASTLASDRDVAFWAEACRVQLISHACPAWGIDHPPGVMVYPAGATFPAGTAVVCRIVDDMNEPGADGEHGLVGDTPYVLIDARASENPAETLSHELLEATCNVRCDRWTTPIQSAGHMVRKALEIGDPVERQPYQIQVAIEGEPRSVWVANFVLPAWFDPTNTTGPWDFRGHLSMAFEVADPPAYAITEIDGTVAMSARLMLGGRWPVDAVALEPRKFRSWSRTSRIVRNHARGIR
jgi:hypothetical protein